MFKNLITLLFILCISPAHAQLMQPGNAGRESIPLAGIWSFKLDPMNVSIPVKGSNLVQKLPEEIILPGSTDQAGKGYKTQDMSSIRLTRMFEYCGAAWYEKENIFVPEHWAGKEIFLFLERAHWETQVWINGRKAGRDESLSTPHVYDITPYIKAGTRNTIRIRVDNRLVHDIAFAHANSAETQTNWNGIIGRMELQASDKVYIEDLQVYPQREQKTLKVVARIANKTGKPVKGSIRLECRAANTPHPVSLPPVDVPLQGSDSLITLTQTCDLSDGLQTWDEFDPHLYTLDCTVGIPAEGYEDRASVRFGIRDFATKGTQFTLNGHTVFIRGAVNSCEFPLTGYPPMDYPAWKHLLGIYKDYGLNCIRFHSWCPPQAAFDAADELGLYLQVENSDWRFTVGEDSATTRFYTEESKRIFRTYGNHPSFAFFCEGNELVGKGCVPFLKEMLKQWKTDPRHLYVAASGYPTVEGSDFYDFYGARPQRWQEGLKGRFNVQPLNTQYDYSDYVRKFTVPMITHEIGQWCAYPDFNQVSKYVGVLKPYNYELFREDLRNQNMLDQAYAFHLASGKFQVIQKKEEFESYFRTPGLGGYYLLQLNDFPGQGTSPVGVVDVFHDPKPYVDAKEFSRIQNPCLPLMRTQKLTWTNNENFTAQAQIANFLKGNLNNAEVAWSIDYPDGTTFERGAFARKEILAGQINDAGTLSVPLQKITKATNLMLRISITGTDIYNEWELWVYPQTLPRVVPKHVLITREWNKKAKEYLEKGGTVWLQADTAKIQSDVAPGFSGISWNAVWSGTPPNLLGILCNPAHAAFADFPTEYYSNWQWFDLIRNSKPMVLDDTPYAFRPLVQIIPDWNHNRKIGLVFEARVGKGKLLVTAIAFDRIMEKSPVARQMYYSLSNYLNSEQFKPKVRLEYEAIDGIFVK